MGFYDMFGLDYASMRMGFDFDVISGIESNKYGLRMNVFEFSWYYTKNQNILVNRDRTQLPIAPYVYKRWELNYDVPR